MINRIASFSLGNKVEEGKVIKYNFYTVLVRFKDKVIKRHKIKHNVTINKLKIPYQAK